MLRSLACIVTGVKFSEQRMCIDATVIMDGEKNSSKKSKCKAGSSQFRGVTKYVYLSLECCIYSTFNCQKKLICFALDTVGLESSRHIYGIPVSSEKPREPKEEHVENKCTWVI